MHHKFEPFEKFTSNILLHITPDFYIGIRHIILFVCSWRCFQYARKIFCFNTNFSDQCNCSRFVLFTFKINRTCKINHAKSSFRENCSTCIAMFFIYFISKKKYCNYSLSRTSFLFSWCAIQYNFSFSFCAFQEKAKFTYGRHFWFCHFCNWSEYPFSNA